MRETRARDAERVRAVHLASIGGPGGEAYTDEQVAAWAHDRDPTAYPFESPQTHFLVADRGRQLVGFGWMKPEADDYPQADVAGEITAVHVHPWVAGRGVGSRLYAELEADALLAGVDSLGRWASRNAVGLYEGKGYRRVTEHRYEFQDGIEGLVVEM